MDRLLALVPICIALAAWPARAERRVALVIGNAAYQVAPLANPARDAQGIASKLRKLGFTVEVALDLKREGMLQVQDRFVRGLRGADLALFYYAGHAVQIADQNYLVPIDAPLPRSEARQLTDGPRQQPSLKRRRRRVTPAAGNLPPRWCP